MCNTRGARIAAAVTEFRALETTGKEQSLVIVWKWANWVAAEAQLRSSDVDLVLLFPEQGETDGARPVANEEFFTRLGQAVVRLLGAPTADGFVLRVDLRLRPFGDSGPPGLRVSRHSRTTLPRHGRDWERYAYVKVSSDHGASVLRGRS